MVEKQSIVETWNWKMGHKHNQCPNGVKPVPNAEVPSPASSASCFCQNISKPGHSRSSVIEKNTLHVIKYIKSPGVSPLQSPLQSPQISTDIHRYPQISTDADKWLLRYDDTIFLAAVATSGEMRGHCGHRTATVATGPLGQSDPSNPHWGADGPSFARPGSNDQNDPLGILNV